MCHLSGQVPSKVLHRFLSPPVLLPLSARVEQDQSGMSTVQAGVSVHYLRPENGAHYLSTYHTPCFGICCYRIWRTATGLPQAGLYPVPAAPFHVQCNTPGATQPPAASASPAVVPAPIWRRATVQSGIPRRHHSFQTERTRVETLHLPQKTAREAAGGRQRKAPRV
uniref:(northern house mosquito) hypothetical protein n=1 Tax=Culex pipiens TaxID=7175 RepID=A0A8D8ARW4_CULPI